MGLVSLLWLLCADASAADAAVAPWSPLGAWYAAPGDDGEGTWRLRLGLAAGPSSNPLRLSAHEQRQFAAGRDGATLSDPGAPWPIDAVGGTVFGGHVGGGWAGQVLGAPATLSVDWRGEFVLRAERVGDHPLSVRFATTFREGSGTARGLQAGKGAVWGSFAVLGNPHAWDRPLPSPDPALHDPFPDTWVPGVRRGAGGEATVSWAVADAVALGALGRVQAFAYPEGLESWSGSAFDLGGRIRWAPTALVFLEWRGGFASELAAGDDPGTSKTEVDPSWAGTRWGLEAGLDGSGVDAGPWRAAVSADLVQRNFRTADLADEAHHQRRDVGLAASATGAWSPPLDWPWGSRMALSLTYTLDWNHTNLPRKVAPPDAGDYVAHTGLLAFHFAHGTR